MSMVRHEIPILEYDDNPVAVLEPNHERLNLKLPEKAVFAFLYDAVDVYAEEHSVNSGAKCPGVSPRADAYAKAYGGNVVAEFDSSTKKYPIYVVEYRGEEICMVQAPVGAAAATQILDWLISYGVKKVISAGSCGTLTDREENVFLVPIRALRDEGTSYHYLPPSRFVTMNPEAVSAIQKALTANGLAYQEVTTWSTDGFYRETAEKVRYRAEEGCAVVEMECAALAACAQFRHILWGEILYTADSLANAEQHDERDWGEKSRFFALTLCLDAVINL